MKLAQPQAKSKKEEKIFLRSYRRSECTGWGSRQKSSDVVQEALQIPRDAIVPKVIFGGGSAVWYSKSR